jgi:hypothetical protein
MIHVESALTQFNWKLELDKILGQEVLKLTCLIKFNDITK